jgi:nitrogen fixation NifU-like protein
MHNPLLLDHFQNPRNVGDLGEGALSVEVSNPACGDTLRLSARLEAGRVAEVRFLVRGCTASIACGSALTEMITGRSVAELRGIQSAALDAAVGGLIAESKHAAVLCLDAVRALAAAAEKRPR